MACTMPWRQVRVGVVASLLQAFLPYGKQIYVKIGRMQRGVENNPKNRESKEDPNPGRQNSSTFRGTMVR